MTVVNMKDLDAQMGRTIDPNSVPKHVGGSQGSMEPNFVAQSDLRIQEQGAGRLGAAVHDARELTGNHLYGSQTIISLNEAPPLEDKMEPKDPSAEAMKKAAAIAGVPKPVPVPVPVVARPVGARSIQQLMAAIRRPGT